MAATLPSILVPYVCIRSDFALFVVTKVWLALEMDMATERVTGLEALLRGQHPDLGLVPPDKFIRIAGNSGLIMPIGEWVLSTACSQARKWQDEGLPAVQVRSMYRRSSFVKRDFCPGVTTEGSSDAAFAGSVVARPCWIGWRSKVSLRAALPAKSGVAQKRDARVFAGDDSRQEDQKVNLAPN